MEAENMHSNYFKKMTIFRYLSSTEDESVIDKIFNLINPSKEKVIKLTSEQKKAIDLGLQQIEEGKVIPHKRAMEELKSRHPKYFR